MYKNFLLFLSISLSLGISQAYSQNPRYLTPRSVDWAVEKEFHCDSIRSGDYLFMPERVADTVHAIQDSISALRADISTAGQTYTAGTGLDVSAGNVFSLETPVTISNGGTGAASLASGYIKSNGSVLSSSATVTGSDVSGNISGNAAGLTANIPISRTTGLQDSITAHQGRISVLESQRLYDSGWITVNSAALNNSGSVPVSIVSAFSGVYQVPEIVLVEYTSGGTGFTNGNMILQGSGLAGDMTGPFNISGTTNFLTFLSISPSSNSTALASNNAIVLSTFSGVNPIGGGNGSVRVRVFSRRIIP